MASAKSFISDNETAVDLLYYEAIAKAVVRFLRQDPATPITVGVHGDWGAGKSSVLKMSELELKRNERTLCLWFNGWAFEGFEDAKTVVLEKIVTELKNARPNSTKVVDAAKKVFRRIQWLKVAKRAGGLTLSAVTGIPPPDILEALIDKVTSIARDPTDAISPETLKNFADDAADFLKASDPTEDSVPAQIHAFRKDFEKLLEAADIDQLVVLVDDLDRCLPETAIATLEAIRLFLFVPRTAFVIGADEAMIEYSVRKHFPDLTISPGTANYARNYLEKLIQVPFRIPALGFAETRTYITLLLALATLGDSDPEFKKLIVAARENLKRPWLGRGMDEAAVRAALGSLPPQVATALRTSAQVSGALTEGTQGNPRQIKRFLNSMSLRQAIAEERGFGSDIETPVLAKLMLAERFQPDLYAALARLSSASADGKVSALRQLEAETDQSADKPKVARKTGEEIAAELEAWLKDPAVIAWAKIEPPIGEKDLRPYMFVTRDKRSFYGGSPLVDHLEPLLERLMGGALSAKGAISDLTKISATEAQQLFEAIRERMLGAESLRKEPPGFKGLVTLVKARPSLQPTLLQMLKELPLDQVGAWVATSSGEAFTEQEARLAFKKQLEEWQRSANPVVKAAAEMALKVPG